MTGGGEEPAQMTEQATEGHPVQPGDPIWHHLLHSPAFLASSGVVLAALVTAYFGYKSTKRKGNR